MCLCFISPVKLKLHKMFGQMRHVHLIHLLNLFPVHFAFIHLPTFAPQPSIKFVCNMSTFWQIFDPCIAVFFPHVQSDGWNHHLPWFLTGFTALKHSPTACTCVAYVMYLSETHKHGSLEGLKKKHFENHLNKKIARACQNQINVI